MRVLVALIAVLAVTAAVYAGVRDHDFIIVDDQAYMIMNPVVQEGLTIDGVRWALTSFDAYNWHPLTWVSLMADVSLVGPDPGPQHLMGVGYHLLATILLFVALWRLTGREWESLLVAALFALHPAHVESVAWVSERKDVLSACFWFLAMWAYAGYAERPGVGRYLLVALAVAAGLMAKPMVVTLPFALLLLDVWPLRRSSWTDVRRLAWLGLEKIPFLVLAAGASVLTVLAQQPGIENTAEELVWGARLGNALVAYASYLRLTVWPDALAAFYPHPGWVPLWQALLAAVLLGAISAIAVLQRERRPYLLVGWLWFVGTLVPVIGVVQVGDQGMADRYMYIPQIGLFLMLAWGLAELARGDATRRAAVAAISVAVVLAFAATTRAQVAHWKNTETLFRYTLSVTERNSFAHVSLATIFMIEGREEEAHRQFEAAVEANPDNAEALNGLGLYRLRAGDPDGALELFMRATEAGAWLFEAQLNAGLVLQEKGRFEEALPYYRAAAKLEPFHPGVQMALGQVNEELGAVRRAAANYRRALQLQPGLEEARASLRRLRRLHPDAVRPRRPRRAQSAGPSAPSRPSGSM